MLILASASPRRAELLRQAGYEFEIDAADIDERLPVPMKAEEAVRWLAHKKAQSVAERHPHDTVLAADTVIALEGKIFGKPKNSANAIQMLQTLSGRTHEVYTGISLYQGKHSHTQSVVTKITFRKLTLAEIKAYVATGEPLDKAGSYAIQGQCRQWVQEIQGDITNVIGLPMSYTQQVLDKMGLKPTKSYK